MGAAECLNGAVCGVESVEFMPRQSSQPDGCRAEVPASGGEGDSVCGCRAISMRTRSRIRWGTRMFGPAGRDAFVGPGCAAACDWKASRTCTLSGRTGNQPKPKAPCESARWTVAEPWASLFGEGFFLISWRLLCQNTTVRQYSRTTLPRVFLKAKLRPAQVLRPSLGQKRTPKAKQHTSMRANGRAT